MGNYDEFEDEFENEPQPQKTAKGLRGQLEEALAALKEVRTENAKLKTQTVTSSLQVVLKKKSLDPRLAKLMAKDEVDASDEKAVDTWLDEYGIVPSTSSEEQTSQDEGAAQLAAMRAAEQNALPSDDKFAEMARRVKETDGSPAAINAVLQGLK